MAFVTALAVGLGGSAGALARYALGETIEQRALDTLALALPAALVGTALGAALTG